MIRKILFPLNLVYRSGVYVRNKLYNFNILSKTNLDTFVVSVGNITAGGTGKTPFTLYLAEYLLSKGKFVAVVSKGYGRDLDEIKVADINYKNHDRTLTVENFGDEGLMILQELNLFSDAYPGSKGLVVVADNKSEGSSLVYKKFHPDVIIVDDAFQHRKLARNLDIVLLNNSKRKPLLPAGNQREPIRNIKRADLVLLNKKFGNYRDKLEKKRPNMPIAAYEAGGFYDIKNKKAELNSKKAVVFCGIGDPNSFKRELREYDINITSFIEFPDHRNYTARDIGRIIRAYNKTNADCIITTQKDMVRILFSDDISEYDNYTELTKLPFFYSRIRMKMISNERNLLKHFDSLFFS